MKRSRPLWRGVCKIPDMERFVKEDRLWVSLSTDRCDPIAAAAWDARPVIIADLGIAFGIGTGNLARNFTLLEEGLHPDSLHRGL